MADTRERAHANSFDLLRLFAAALVVWSHQHALLGLPEPAVASLNTSFGGLEVFIFFSISVYLNTLSIARHNSLQTFLINRALRIYPALVACVLFTVVLGICVATDLHAYLGPELISYVVKNTTLFFGFQGGAPGVFEANALPQALNGSLWTLKYEVKLYVALAAVFAVCRYSLLAPIFLFAALAVTLTLMHLGVLEPYQGDQYWVQFSTLFLAASAVASIEILAGTPIAIVSLVLSAAIVAALGNQFLARELLLTLFIITAAACNFRAGFNRRSTSPTVPICMRFRSSKRAHCTLGTFGRRWRSRQASYLLSLRYPFCSSSGRHCDLRGRQHRCQWLLMLGLPS